VSNVAVGIPSANRYDMQGRKSFIGISTSSLFMSLFRDCVLFLYLQDAGSSWLILASFAKDIVYTAWKIWNITKVRMEAKRNLQQGSEEKSGGTDNKLEFETAEYDRIAMTHVMLALGPMALGFTFYSLVYFTHKSWYSWAVSSLADAVYFFGFAALTPQLYINYKLMSVAHLPLRAFAYKTFSTFIDDVFAFIVEMPLKHRLMTLRDDVIFVGFLYQWYVA
jgi:hypothetical protein